MVSRLSVGVLLAVVGAGCATLPRAGKPSMPDVQYRMRDFRLANGMRIIVEEDHAAPLVGVFTVVGVGSSGDPTGRAGLAHLMEHLAFRAKPGGKMTAWNQLEAAGVGFLNAQTNLDNTTYMEVGSKDLLPKLLTLEAGRLLNPMVGVDEKVFEVEREVVRNELRQRGENAIGPAFNFLQEAAFPKDHSYSRPVGGSHDSLSAISFDDAKKFAAEHYKPANLTMLVIGDVDLATVDQILLRALPMAVWQPLPQTTEPFPPRLRATVTEPPAPPPERLIRRQSTVPSPELYVVWSLPRSFDSETVLLDFVRGVAARELSHAFYSDPDIVGVSVNYVPGVEASMFIAQATLRKGEHVEASYEKLLDQLVKTWAPGMDAGDDAMVNFAIEQAFVRQRNGAVMDMTLEAENIMFRGMERVTSAHFTGDPLMYSRRLKALTLVSTGQVSHYAEKYLQRSRARAVLVEPFAADAKGAANGPAGLAPTSSDPLTTPLPAEAVRQLGKAHAERAKFETVVTAKPDHLVSTLENGLKVVIHKRRNALPVVVVELTFTTGAAGTTPKGAAALANMMASPRGHLYGTGGDFGIDWSSRIGQGRSTVVGTGASGNLPNLLAQLAERVTTMHVEDGSLAFFKKEFAEYLKQSEQLPQAKAGRALDAALFKGHPYGEHPSVEDQLALSAGDLDRWFDRAWSPANAVLVVTGDLDTQGALEDVKRWLSGWPRAKDPFPAVPPLTMRSEATPTFVVTHQSGATQAQVHLACLAETGPLDKSMANQTTANLLATALFEKIRGELGASYGFGGGATPLTGTVDRLDWQGSIENSRLGESLAVLSGAIRDFETQTLTDRALERARWEVARQMTLDGATAGTAARTFTERTLAGRESDASESVFDSLAGVGREQLLPGWRQCRGSLTVSLTGDEPTIREALKKASF